MSKLQRKLKNNWLTVPLPNMTTADDGKLYGAVADEMAWIPWGMRGAQFKLLSADPASGRFTILIKIAPGVTARRHRHVNAVEAYVLEGGFHYLEDPDRRFTKGAYLLESAGSVHQPASPEGVVMLAVFHGAVEGLDEQGEVMGRIDWKWHVDAWNAAVDCNTVDNRESL